MKQTNQMSNNWISHPTILKGQLVDLIPLEEIHFEDLFFAASDKKIWEFYTGDWSVKETFLKVYKESMNQRDKGSEYPFVIFYKPTSRIIGSTRFLDIVYTDKRLEIGGTWIQAEYWASAVNFDCKLALLNFCFENLHAKRVQLKTQHDNLRSRKAIEKIGGVYEGIIRQHMLKEDGTYRSSAYFSILNDEWERVKLMISRRLQSKMNN